MQKDITNMSISLPKKLKEFVRHRTKQSHHSTPSDYIRSLIRDDLKRQSQEQLELMLMDGLSSGDGIQMTDKKWEELREEVQKRLKKHK